MPATSTEQTTRSVALATAVLAEGQYAAVEPAPLWQTFNAVAERCAERTAVTCGGEHLSYRELNAQANELAERLRELGVGPEVLVGVYLERTTRAIVALVAILKAGGAYLPLDPAYPTERIATIVEDARPTVVLTEKQLAANLPVRSGNVVVLDEDVATLSARELVATDPGARPDNLAYVIYTSGSTGKPKGVMVTHANVARLLTSTDAWFHFNERDVWTLFHSLAFDFSVWEIWGCLLTGGRLVIVPFTVSRSPQDFYDLLVKERVTILNQTPSAFYQLIEEDRLRKSPRLQLRVVVFGGEALNFRLLEPWFAAHKADGPRLINMYGITETTVHVTYREVSAKDAETGMHSLIGVPIPDLRIYLLDENRKPVAPGEVGEIYVGGAGVARGYLNRPELNAERFVADPHGDVAGARMYRSGDLARFMQDGELEYLGRGDAQVKIQGFRIELGEVESAILAHEQVKAARVVPHTDDSGAKRLIAYYISRDNANLSSSEISESLHKKLPPWMLPSAYVAVDSFPLTANGKLDAGALPKPTFGSTEAADLLSGSDLEKKVAAIWRRVLGAAHVGLNDNFFDIGGTSLLIVQIHKELQTLLGRRISIAELFGHTTVRSLASRLGHTDLSSESAKPVQDRAQQQRAAFARARAMKKAMP